jgi:hypothetical protein
MATILMQGFTRGRNSPLRLDPPAPFAGGISRKPPDAYAITLQR